MNTNLARRQIAQLEWEETLHKQTPLIVTSHKGIFQWLVKAQD